MGKLKFGFELDNLVCASRNVDWAIQTGLTWAWAFWHWRISSAGDAL